VHGVRLLRWRFASIAGSRWRADHEFSGWSPQAPDLPAVDVRGVVRECLT
jgi:hypothetical protein